MDSENMRTNSSLAGGFGLALLATTCCALPILLVALGMGSAMASLASALPWLQTLATYKAITFTLTALILTYAFTRLRNVSSCTLADKRRLQMQRAVLWVSTGILAVSVFAAYALLPLTLWWEQAL